SLPHDMKEKIALFCDVDVQAVITASDVHSVYEVPLVFAEQGVDEIILRILRMEAKPRDLSRWTACRIRKTKWISRSSESTSNTRIPTRVSRKRCCMVPWRTG